MLQWMGGSRRKVATSRKSTHKRQKQYFEQRKRQQQQQKTGLESYADGRGSCGENNRSLDILSLVNVSTVDQDSKTSCMNEGRDDSEGYGFNLNHQYANPSLAILNDKSVQVDQAEMNEERISSSYSTEPEYSKKVSVHLPDHNEDLVGNEDKLDPFKLSSMLPDEISVIDLLGDGRSNSNTEENAVHVQEGHVAFSIQGLGKVDTQTPLHSPKIPCRSSPIGFFSRQNASRQPIGPKHMDYGFDDLGPQMDVMTPDVDFSPYYSSIKQTFCSKDMMNIIGAPNLNLNFRNSSSVNRNASNFQDFLDSDEIIYNIPESGKKNWNEDSSDDLGEHEIFCKNWADQRNVASDDYFHNKDLWNPAFNFDGWNLRQKRSNAKRTETFDIRESPIPYTKHQNAEDLSDTISNIKWYSAAGIDNDVIDSVNRFVKEDNKESLSLLSEESCSSTAVRGDTSKKTMRNKA